MKVLHIQKVGGIGGSERHLLDLLPSLRTNGIDGAFLVLDTEGAEAFVAELAARAIPHERVAIGGDLSPALPRRIASVIRSFQPDLVHTHLIHADLYGQVAARLTGTPAVSSVHSVHRFYTRFPSNVAMRMAGRLARRRIVISRCVERFLLEHHLTPAERLRVVHYGIDARRWAVGDPERAGERAAAGLEGTDFVLGIAGRMVPFKGHDVLIEAVARLVPQLPNLRLHLAGDGPLRAELEDQVRARDLSAHVRFWGHVAEVPRFMAICDAVAMPSQPGDGEGLGLAVLEAMAAGKPVVASDMDALPELVEHGSTGMLVPPSDEGALADAVKTLVRDRSRAEEMGRAAWERVGRLFSLDRMVDRTLAVYDEALRAR